MDEQTNELVTPFLQVQGRKKREKFILMDGQEESDKEENVPILVTQMTTNFGVLDHRVTARRSLGPRESGKGEKQ